MSKKSNVNPNHYKTAGRDRPGDNLGQEKHRLNFTRGRAERQQAVSKQIPPAASEDIKEDKTELEGNNILKDSDR